MTTLETTALGYKLPHPDNPARTVDVPRLRDALSMIDAHVAALQAQAGDLAADKADKLQVAIDIAAAVSQAISDLLNGAPAAYDTLVEIAAKLTDNDDVVAGILSTLALKANAADVATALALKADAAAMTDALALKADADAMTVALAGKTSPAEVAATVQAAAVPVGAIVAAVKPPGPGWLPCDNAVYLKAAYPALAGHLGSIMDKVHQAPVAASIATLGSGITSIKKLNGNWLATSSRDVFKSTANRVSWTSVFAPGNFGLADIAFGNGRYLTVGTYSEGGFSASSTSPDSGWSAIAPIRASAVEFAFGYFAAVGFNGLIATNSGVGAWTVQSSGTTANLNAILTRPGRVIVGGDSGKILFSDNLATWHVAPAPSTYSVYCFLDEGDRILAGCGSGRIWQSFDDGETWSDLTVTGSAGSVNLLAKVGGVYFALQSSSGSRFSRDLATWVTAAGLPAVACGIVSDGIISLGSASSLMNFAPYSYDHVTEFSVPGVSDLLGTNPSEVFNGPRWIRALAA